MIITSHPASKERPHSKTTRGIEQDLIQKRCEELFRRLSAPATTL
jgi:hypothetical protein